MIRLKEIQVDKSIAVVDCVVFVEDAKEPVKVRYNIETKTIGYTSLPSGYEWCKKHIVKAQKAIEEMVNTGRFVAEKTVMWY